MPTFYSADRPRWYALGLDIKKQTLIISVRPDVASFFEEVLTKDAPIVKDYEVHLKQVFCPPNQSNWGFGQTLASLVDKKGGWPTLRVGLPASGTPAMNWTIASLSVAFAALSYFDLREETGHPTSLENSQLLALDYFGLGDGRMSSCGFSATMFPACLKMVGLDCLMGDHAVPEVEEAMIIAYRKMLPRLRWTKSSHYDFRVKVRKGGGVNISCPGNACDLGPESYVENLDRPYSMVPHNVDSPSQQLTHLVGLAALHEYIDNKRTPV